MSRSPAAATWRALGTTASVLVDDHAALNRARASVEAELAAIDRACSRFRDDSELARLNSAHGRPMRVSPLFLEALEAALRAARVTDGAVDPTIGEALILAGYDRDFALVSAGAAAGAPALTAGPAAGAPMPAAGTPAFAADTPMPAAGTRTSPAPTRRVHFKRAPGVDSISLDRTSETVTVPRGVRIDLGASAKALAADRSAAAAHAATQTAVLVSLGGDIAVAGPPPTSGWAVRVCDDHEAGPDAPGQTVAIFSGGLATSSTTVRRWDTENCEAGGRDSDGPHHIIDPASGRPAEVVWSTVSVAAATCVDANTAATAAIVLGHRAPDWLAGTGLPARLVAADGEVRRIGAWPSEEDL